MNSFQHLYDELVAARDDILKRARDADDKEEVDRIMEPVAQKIEALVQCAPSDMKEDLQRELDMFSKVRKEVKTAAAIARLSKHCKELFDNKQMNYEEHMAVLKADLEVVDELREFVDDAYKAEIEKARSVIDSLVAQPSLFPYASMVEHDHRLRCREDIVVVDELEKLKSDLCEIDASNVELSDVRKQDVEDARAMVLEIEALPDDQRVTLEVYREILTMRRCVSLLAKYGDDVMMAILMSTQLCACFAVLDNFDNKTEEQESEILAAKQKYKFV